MWSVVRDMGDVILSVILSGWMWMYLLLQNASFQSHWWLIVTLLINPVWWAVCSICCVGHPYKSSWCRRTFAQRLTVDWEGESERVKGFSLLLPCDNLVTLVLDWPEVDGLQEAWGLQALVAVAAHSSVKWKGGTRILSLQVRKTAGSCCCKQTSLFWKT